MYVVYVLKSLVAKKSYVGITNDINRRLIQHNQGHNTYTKRYLPWRIIYTEEFDTRESAHNREKYLKTSSGRKWLKVNVFK